MLQKKTCIALSDCRPQHICSCIAVCRQEASAATPSYMWECLRWLCFLPDFDKHIAAALVQAAMLCFTHLHGSHEVVHVCWLACGCGVRATPVRAPCACSVLNLVYLIRLST